MILTCPACGTSYVVKDGAIPAQGRQVRCASCKHSWHEAGGIAFTEAEAAPPSAAGTVSAMAETPAPAVPGQAVAEGPVSPDAASAAEEPSDQVETAPQVSEPLVAPPAQLAEPPAASVDAFADWDDGNDYDVVAPRRRGLLTLVLLVLFVAALAVAAWFFAPREWLARAGLREAAGNSPLKLMVSGPGRQKLASGNDLVSLSGRIINPTEQSVTVPPLQADLRDGGGKLVYSWTIAPPAPRLPPRGSASFNSAELGVPPNATSLTLRWSD